MSKRTPRPAIISTQSRQSELESDMPADADHDNLPIKMAAFEQIVFSSEVEYPGHYAPSGEFCTRTA